MLIALLSDIHANGPAMAAVREAVERSDPDLVVVAGDTVGYYYWPKEVLEHLGALKARMIRGNHEDELSAARAARAKPGCSPSAWGSAIEACFAQLSDAELDQLENLPRTLTETTDHGALLVCHGSPQDPVRYVYPDISDAELSALDPEGHRWVVMGHTHYPMVRNVAGVSYVNPGSVGQPRNGVPGAAWALLDTAAGSVDFRVEEYDMSSVLLRAASTDPDLPYLQEVLVRRR